mgnify:FL=1
MKKTICLALAVILCVGIVFGFALSVSEPAVAASNQEKLEEAKKNLEAARNEIKDIKNRLAELGNNKQELMAKKNLLDEQIEATEAQIALINSALEVIEKELEEKGIKATVIDMFTLKPLDRQAVIDAAKKTGTVVTVENHYVNNGLGSAVAEVLCEECPTPLIRLGSQDKFGEVGSRDFLAQSSV